MDIKQKGDTQVCVPEEMDVRAPNPELTRELTGYIRTKGLGMIPVYRDGASVLRVTGLCSMAQVREIE